MTPSVTENNVLAALRAFLQSVLPANVDIVRGQANLVPEPKHPDFIVLTPNRRSRLATTVALWDRTDPAVDTMTYSESTEIDVQLDFHGEMSTDNAQVVTTLLRSNYACEYMSGLNVQPLFCDDGQQVPFINAEQQYEDRWIINAVLQATPDVSTNQQFANTLAVELGDQNTWSDL